MNIKTSFARIDKEMDEIIRNIQKEWESDGYPISFREASKIAARKLKKIKLRPMI